MFEGIPLESYGMAGMVLIIAVMLVWKGAEVLKVALENKRHHAEVDDKKEEKDDDTPVGSLRKGSKTLMLENLKEKQKEQHLSIDERFDRLEAAFKEKLDTAFYEIGRLRDETNVKFDKVDARLGKKEGTDEKQAEQIADLKSQVSYITAKLEK